MDAQADKQHGTENEKLDEKECKKMSEKNEMNGKQLNAMRSWQPHRAA